MRITKLLILTLLAGMLSLTIGGCSSPRPQAGTGDASEQGQGIAEPKAAEVDGSIGYVVELSNGTRIYATGDTSTTDDMRDGTLASMNIDYAFWCSDGVYNMGTQEASEAARMVGAKVNIPYHNSTSNRPSIFDEDIAEQFAAPGALILYPGDKIYLDAD